MATAKKLPSPKGKRKCEQLAAEWAATKEATIAAPNIAVGEAIDKYIQQRSAVLSPATVKEYKASRKRDLQELMDVKLDVLTQEQIQKAINRECLTHSPKTVSNMHGLLTVPLLLIVPILQSRQTAKEEAAITLHPFRCGCKMHHGIRQRHTYGNSDSFSSFWPDTQV